MSGESDLAKAVILVWNSCNEDFISTNELPPPYKSSLTVLRISYRYVNYLINWL